MQKERVLYAKRCIDGNFADKMYEHLRAEMGQDGYATMKNFLSSSDDAQKSMIDE